MTTDLMKNCLQQCFCRSNVKRKIKHLQNIMTSMLHNLQIKRSFLLQFSFFFEGKIYIQLLNIDKSFAAASAFFKEIIGLISYERNIIFFVCQLFLRNFSVPVLMSLVTQPVSRSAEFLKDVQMSHGIYNQGFKNNMNYFSQSAAKRNTQVGNQMCRYL